MNETTVSGIARGRHLPVSAQKARRVINQIRGQRVADALNTLTFSRQKAARLILKVLESAIANAEHNNGVDIDALSVVHVSVDEGPVLKRMKPRAKYRADRILKRTCHVTVVLA